MGFFYTAPKKPATPAAHDSFSGSSRHISPRELREQVRHDLHDRLGQTKGESVYEILDAHLDRDHNSSAHGVSGREIDGMLRALEDNHQDRLHEQDIAHIRDVLGKHFHD